MALLLGYASIKRMLAEMDAEEYLNWLAYAEIEPLPYSWAETGRICTTIAESFSGRKCKPSDFMPLHTMPVKRSSPAAIREGMSFLHAMRAAQELSKPKVKTKVTPNPNHK